MVGGRYTRKKRTATKIPQLTSSERMSVRCARSGPKESGPSRIALTGHQQRPVDADHGEEGLQHDGGRIPQLGAQAS